MISGEAGPEPFFLGRSWYLVSSGLPFSLLEVDKGLLQQDDTLVNPSCPLPLLERGYSTGCNYKSLQSCW